MDNEIEVSEKWYFGVFLLSAIGLFYLSFKYIN